MTGSSMRLRASLAVQKASASHSARAKSAIVRRIAVKYPESKKSLTPENGPESDDTADVVAKRNTRS